jgi:hypothetical protein
MVAWMMRVATGLLLSTIGTMAWAQDGSGLHLIVENTNAPPPMTMASGIYIAAGLGAMAGGQEPRAVVVHIAKVDGDALVGTLEILRLDSSGALVRLQSAFTGSMGATGLVSAPGMLAYHPTPPFALTLQDEPLRSLLQSVQGHMLPDGFYLGWEVTGKTLGTDQVGTNALFAATDEDAYRQVVAQYQQMGAYKSQLMALQADAAKQLLARIDGYHQASGRWTAKSADDGLEDIVARSQALYLQEKRLLSGTDPGRPADAHRQAALLVMQLATYYSQANYLIQQQDEQDRYQRSLWNSLQMAVDSSPCMESTSPRLAYGVAPACQGLMDAYDAARRDQKQMIQSLGQAAQRRRGVQERLGCLMNASRHLIQPTVGLIPLCDKQLPDQG